MDHHEPAPTRGRLQVRADDRPELTPLLAPLLAPLRSAGLAAELVRSAAALPGGDGVTVLDLGAGPVAGAWHLAADDVVGLDALVVAVTAGRLPVVEVRAADGAARAAGRPGTELPGVPDVAVPDVLAGVGVLLAAALTGRPPAAPQPDARAAAGAGGASATAEAPTAPGLGARATGAARALAGRAARVAYRRLFLAPHWRVGYRWVPENADGVVELLDHPAAGWRDLPDDGWHFYADPFPFLHEGRTWLFVEDFDHRVGRGVVSVVEMTEAGPVGTPRVVLEHEVHLSYPFVFDHDGEVWMVPETSGAGTIELYRATSFPDRWERDRVLVEGVEASDATLFEHEGRWWMLATVRHGGSFSDALHAWTADDPLGPWTEHAGNPLLVDIASARPAGRVVRSGGRLVRPVQDNRGGYGAELGLVAIDRLDDDGLEQHLLATVRAGGRWPGRRLHTLNRAGRLEVLDGSRLVLRPAPLRPLLGRLASR